MRDQLRAIIGEQAKLARPIDTIGDDTDLFDAGMDSLAVVNVMLAIEEEFNLELPDSLLSRHSFSSIAALERALQSVVGAAAVAS